MFLARFVRQGLQELGPFAELTLPGFFAVERVQDLHRNCVLVLLGECFHPLQGLFQQTRHKLRLRVFRAVSPPLRDGVLPE